MSGSNDVKNAGLDFRHLHRCLAHLESKEGGILNPKMLEALSGVFSDKVVADAIETKARGAEVGASLLRTIVTEQQTAPMGQGACYAAASIFIRALVVSVAKAEDVDMLVGLLAMSLQHAVEIKTLIAIGKRPTITDIIG